MMDKICLTCRAFNVDDGDVIGSCQLHPPIPIGDCFMFPGVHPYAWCLDWQPKERPLIEKKQGKRAWSDELKPTEKHAELAQRLKISMGEEWGKFKNYCLAHDKRYANFEAAFRNWLVSSVNMNGGKR